MIPSFSQSLVLLFNASWSGTCSPSGKSRFLLFINREMAPFFFPSSSYSGFGKGENIYFYETLQEYQLSIVMTIHNGYVFKVIFIFLFLRILKLTLAWNISLLLWKRKERNICKLIARNVYKYWISDEHGNIFSYREKKIYIYNEYLILYFILSHFRFQPRETNISFLPSLKEDGEAGIEGSISVNRINRSDYRE